MSLRQVFLLCGIILQFVLASAIDFDDPALPDPGSGDPILPHPLAISQPPNPCLTNNGGCQQICTNNGGAAQCSCYAGFTLESNRMTCNEGQEETIAYKERYNVYREDTIFEDFREPRSAIDPDRQWVNGRVPYIIGDNISDEKILKAIQEFETKTCIRWIKQTTEEEYIIFSAKHPENTTDTVCESWVGRIDRGRSQLLTLTPGCNTSDTIHEMMHALGFFHEHQRPDRDNYVNIVDNIIRTKEKEKVIEDNIKNLDKGSFTLDTPYDYTSIMHYPSYLGSGLPNMTSKTSQKISPAKGLSDIDVLDISIYYNCFCPGAPLHSIVCQDETKTISCPAGKVLKVVGAVFGRIEDQGVTCPSDDLKTNVKNCTLALTFEIVRDRCENKSKCSLNASFAEYVDPCPGIYKYLSVVYRCKPVGEMGWCTCGGKGEPHFSTCDGRHFPYPAPIDKIGNLASDQGNWWYVWTKHALYESGPRTYISAVRFGCDSHVVDFYFNPPGNSDAPETLIDGVLVTYPPTWKNKLPPTGANGTISAGNPGVEVGTFSFPKIPGGDKPRTYLAAYCVIDRAADIRVYVFVRLRTVVVQIHPDYRGNITGICGDYNGIANNDETNLANTPPWAPLLMP